MEENRACQKAYHRENFCCFLDSLGGERRSGGRHSWLLVTLLMSSCEPKALVDDKLPGLSWRLPTATLCLPSSRLGGLELAGEGGQAKRWL